MSAQPLVWIVDDDAAIRWVLDKALRRVGLEARLFADGAEALSAARQALAACSLPQVLLTDVRLTGSVDGFTLAREFKALMPQLIVIIMTAYSDLEAAVRAFEVGAFEYLPKPFDINEATALIMRSIEAARASFSAPAGSDALESEKSLRGIEDEPQLIGNAPAMQAVYRAIGRLSTSNATVLVLGETGTGKELVARALHRTSSRRRGPFVAINTAAIPKELLEAELFGVERGAYTGATAARPGRFEEADGGTLFLDEIGDMPLELQTRLLRVLALGEFYRLGGREVRRVDVRIIAATHQDLAAKVAAGAFRADLYHRLNVIRIVLPPLRERREDIALLAEHFLQTIAQHYGLVPKRLTPEALECLQAQPFPGNVRELENLCHWLTVMAPAALITPEDLPKEYQTPPSAPLQASASLSDQLAALPVSASRTPLASVPPWYVLLEEELVKHLTHAPRASSGGERLYETLRLQFDQAVLRAALQITSGNRRRAAALLGVSRNAFQRKGIENSSLK